MIELETFVASLTPIYLISAAAGVFIFHMIQNHLFLCNIIDHIEMARGMCLDTIQRSGRRENKVTENFVVVHQELHNIDKKFSQVDIAVTMNYRSGVLLAVSLAVMSISSPFLSVQLAQIIYAFGVTSAVCSAVWFAITLYFLGKWELEYRREKRHNQNKQ